MRTTWRLLARQRDLRLAVSAALVSLSGDWILRIGLVYHVYAVTRSTVASAILMLASFAPQVLVGPVAGVFADRWDRKRAMVVADVLLALGLVPLLAMRGAGDAWIAFLVMAWEGVVQQFFSPAEQAMLPRLVPDEELLAANAVNGQARDVARLAGSALGGLVAVAGGVAGVALADAASFVMSALLIAMVRADARPERPELACGRAGHIEHAGGRAGQAGRAGAPGGWQFTLRIRAVGQEFADGLRRSARHRILRALMIFVLVTSTGEGIMATLFAPFVRHILHGSGEMYGVIAAAQAVGGIAGGLLPAFLSRRARPAKMFAFGAIAFGVVDLAIFLYPLAYVAVWPAVAGMVIVGLPGALTMAGLITLFQNNTSDSHRGRVFGAVNALEGIAILAGALGAGYLARPAGIIPVLAMQGAGYVVAGAAMLAVLRGDLRQRDAGPAAGYAAAGSTGTLDGPGATVPVSVDAPVMP